MSARTGPVDVLVDDAGTRVRHDSAVSPLADSDEVLSVNPRAVFQLCRGSGVPVLERGAGEVVDPASLLSSQGGSRVPACAAPEGAVARLTRALADERAARGVNVNAVAPGYVQTDVDDGWVGR